MAKFIASLVKIDISCKLNNIHTVYSDETRLQRQIRYKDQKF